MNSKTKLSLILPESYAAFLQDIKAALSVNQELIMLHWWIGHEIAKRQENEKWGEQDH